MADAREVEGFSGFEESLLGFLVIDLDGGKRVVMEAEDVLCSGPVCGLDGILDAHGEGVADAEGGELERGGFADDLHVHREGGITGVVEIALGALDDPTGGVSSVGAVRKGAGVDGVDHLGGAEGEVSGAAMVHGVAIGDTLLIEPEVDFERAEDGGIGAFGDGDDIGDVVFVGVGEEDIVGGYLVDAYMACAGVGGDEGVEEERFILERGTEAGVSVVGDLHGCVCGLGVSVSGYARRYRR